MRSLFLFILGSSFYWPVSFYQNQFFSVFPSWPIFDQFFNGDVFAFLCAFVAIKLLLSVPKSKIKTRLPIALFYAVIYPLLCSFLIMLFIGLEGFFSEFGFNVAVIILVPLLTFLYVINCSDILSEDFSQSTISADQSAGGAEKIFKKKILEI